MKIRMPNVYPSLPEVVVSLTRKFVLLYLPFDICERYFDSNFSHLEPDSGYFAYETNAVIHYFTF